MMSSLVFNTGTILVSSLAVAQFNTIAFSQYAQFSASNQCTLIHDQLLLTNELQLSLVSIHNTCGT